LLGADFAIADSTLMVLLWNLIQRDRIPKLSGLKYLRVLLEHSLQARHGCAARVPLSTDSVGIHLRENRDFICPSAVSEQNWPAHIR
ncbi:MAG: hypothetical protein ABSG47_11285, partial [Terracidiphilus sp.]